MALTVFLLLLVLGTGEGLGSAAPGARGTRAGTRAGGEVLRQGEQSGMPFRVGTGGYRSQRHPGSRDIVQRREAGCAQESWSLGAQTAAPLPCPKGSAKGWAVPRPAGAGCARGL